MLDTATKWDQNPYVFYANDKRCRSGTHFVFAAIDAFVQLMWHPT